VETIRTPDERFENLPGYDFAPKYFDFDGIRLHYLDEGPADANPVLLLHGEPSWCYLYRKMIPILVAAGHRCIAPDLLGFGRSDKPIHREDYTVQLHIDSLTALLHALDLNNATLVGQDWGGILGLRLAAENEERFARICIANTGLPTGEQRMSEAFNEWKAYSQNVKNFRPERIIERTAAMGVLSEGQDASATTLPPEVVAAYDAPFPDDQYKAGARMFPALVPCTSEMAGAAENRAAWEILKRWKKPFLTAFSDCDPVTRGGERYFKKVVPGAQGQRHTTIVGGSHFLQEDKGEVLAQVITEFLAN
jgi:haloalkane dehalogenase